MGIGFVIGFLFIIFIYITDISDKLRDIKYLLEEILKWQQ